MESDVCIIGAGAAGITIAKRLAGDSLEVCLLESGGLNSPNGAQSLADGSNVGLSYYPLSSSRLRYFGGSTNHWGGYCAPLHPIDFQKRSWVPHSGWPISREDLDPYYADAHDLLQLGPFEYEPQYWEGNVRDFRRLFPNSSRISNSVVQFSNSQFRVGKGEKRKRKGPTRMGHRYRREIVKAENVTVITNATATELETTSSAHTVTGVRVECLDGNMFRVRAGRYVLACGALQNARLLLLSDRHAPNGLGNKNDLVGRFFMEHPHVPSASVLLSESRSLDAYRRYYSRLRQPRFYLRIDPRSQRSERVLNCSARLDTRASGLRAGQSLYRRLGMEKFRFGSDLSEIEPDIESVLADFEGVLSGINDALREGSKKRPQFRRVNVMTIAEQAPNPNSRVQLGDSLNEFGQPELELDWRLTALDKRSIVRLNTALAQELGRRGLGRLRIPEWVQAEGWEEVEKEADLSRLWWPKSPDRVNGGWHHMGTTRMKDTPKEGVCNKDCRVFGVDNLYVAGSSLFPTSGSAPPTLTIMALSLRLAEHLQEFSETS